MNNRTIQKIAKSLRRAEEKKFAVERISLQYPYTSYDDVRRVALAHDKLPQDEGQVRVGYKLSWTSAEMRNALGIDKPN